MIFCFYQNASKNRKPHMAEYTPYGGVRFLNAHLQGRTLWIWPRML